jgi:UDP-N-acetyl-D-glucosamine/UDP-N-acetyl-D-galactosamine dehydrogenase
MNLSNYKIGIIGLGYVGLPLAVAFAKKFSVVGYDIKQNRIDELSSGVDSTLEVEASELIGLKNLLFSSNSDELKNCNFYIVTVPTPIDSHKEPDMQPLKSASKLVGEILQEGDIVVYESTVYPGATEEVCVPILETISKLHFQSDFTVGYSPERINPGDKEHRLENIVKLVSGSDIQTAHIVDAVYSQIITAGTFITASIKVAEAAKVIENTQRDLNIALINELSKIFNIMEIDTEAVLRAAGTKWNFLNFRPGLVGGHCIGVDPYYLAHKAQSLGYHPEIIMAGRRMNDGMGDYVVSNLISAMLQSHIDVNASRVLIMGFTFKENCPDIRNSRVVDILKGLKALDICVDIYDPWVEETDIKKMSEINFVTFPEQSTYDAVVIAVAHNEFRSMNANGIKALCKSQRVIYDLKYVLDIEESDLRL